MRLDPEKLEVLRTWGEGLTRDDRDEVRSAGKAIVLLIEEIERLNVDLWNARAGVHAEPEPAEEPRDEPAGSLRQRLAVRLRAIGH